MVLQDDPLAPISTIAKRIGMSNSSTAERIKKLQKENLAFKGVHADLNLDTLGLEIHDFFYRVNSYQNLLFLENQLCYNHPYVLYRGRCYGKFAGIYIQFRIPKGGLGYLVTLNEELRKRKIIENAEYIKRNTNERGVSIKSSLHCWERDSNSWKFDWGRWQESFEDTPTTSKSNIKSSKIPLDSLDEMDIKLLSELTINARTKNISLIKKIGLDERKIGISQLISRKLSFLKKYAIFDYRIFLNWKYFDLYQTIMIKGHTNEQNSRKLRNFLLIGEENKKNLFKSKNYNKSLLFFPFESVFYIFDEGFMWYVRAPPAQMSELSNFLWKICPSYDIFWIDYSYSEFYALWDQTFDHLNHQWRLDDKFMIYSVLGSNL